MSQSRRGEAKVQMASQPAAPAATPPPREAAATVTTDDGQRRKEDAELVARAQGGDRAAFAALLRRYERRVFSVANGMLRNADDAKDVTQEAFWKAHNALASFDGQAQFFTWMYRITVNLSIDYLRKRRGLRVEFDDARANGEGEVSDPTGLS